MCLELSDITRSPRAYYRNKQSSVLILLPGITITYLEYRYLLTLTAKDGGYVRFELLNDDQLQDNVVKYAILIFEEYLKATGTNLLSLNVLSNSELDSVLQRFYAGARQKDGTLYSKKSMLAIRFGLQCHFLSTKNVDNCKA